MKIKTFEIGFAPGRRELDEDVVNAFLSGVEVAHIESAVLPDRNLWALAVMYEERPKEKLSARRSDKIAFEQGCDLSEVEQERYDTLRVWRNERARELGYEAYMVASNDALLSVAKCPVECAEELLKIKGFGPKKVELYGEEIVALLNSI